MGKTKRLGNLKKMKKLGGMLGKTALTGLMGDGVAKEDKELQNKAAGTAQARRGQQVKPVLVCFQTRNVCFKVHTHIPSPPFGTRHYC